MRTARRCVHCPAIIDRSWGSVAITTTVELRREVSSIEPSSRAGRDACLSVCYTTVYSGISEC